MPQAMPEPSKAGPAEQAQVTSQSLLPEDQFAVGADVDEEGEFFGTRDLGGQDTGGDISPNVGRHRRDGDHQGVGD